MNGEVLKSQTQQFLAISRFEFYGEDKVVCSCVTSNVDQFLTNNYGFFNSFIISIRRKLKPGSETSLLAPISSPIVPVRYHQLLQTKS